GFIHLQLMRDFFLPAQNCHISDLAVARDQDGQGVGSALLAYADRFAREHHCRHVQLAVFPGNTRARELYERSGFGVEMLRMMKPLR
ncbi:MAG: GNAT family N-acetyltransferase, partial [Dokdonella sp.]